jgi:hypothetical protein
MPGNKTSRKRLVTRAHCVTVRSVDASTLLDPWAKLTVIVVVPLPTPVVRLGCVPTPAMVASVPVIRQNVVKTEGFPPSWHVCL